MQGDSATITMRTYIARKVAIKISARPYRSTVRTLDHADVRNAMRDFRRLSLIRDRARALAKAAG